MSIIEWETLVTMLDTGCIGEQQGSEQQGSQQGSEQ